MVHSAVLMGDSTTSSSLYEIRPKERPMVDIILTMLAIVFYTCSQLVQHGKFKWSKPGFGFFGESSDRRKYRLPLRPAPSNRYYKTFDIRYKEWFPGSATVFVSFTDAYHFFQALFKICLCLAITSNLLNALIAWLVFGAVFTLTYKFLSK
jgi:hypothetical protein